MAFGVSANRSLASRGPSAGFRFTLYAIVCVTLMFLDQRGGWLNQVRYVLQGAAYPIQLAVSSPSAAWRWVSEAAQTREALRAENAQLRLRQRDLEVRTLRYEALARENAQLRGLREALPPVAEKWLVAEVVNIEPNSLRQSVLLNRGTRNGVFAAQAVLDDAGLIGQTTHVGPWSAEVILITDQEHSLPVQVERTGLRTIAVGTGKGLALPYLPANADVKPGDLLITSGLGGVFPEGYPVGRVSGLDPQAVQPNDRVRATPLARMDRAREVMLVWFRETHPAAPGKTSGADLVKGDPKALPQVAPPKPKPAPAAVAEAGTASPANAAASKSGANGTSTVAAKPGASGTSTATPATARSSSSVATAHDSAQPGRATESPPAPARTPESPQAAAPAGSEATTESATAAPSQPQPEREQ
jgi:rod shape-determining protein MreC